MHAAVLSVPGATPAWAEHPDPVPAPGSTLVTVTAAAIVPLDLLCASGTSYFGAPACPYVPGTQGVGVVEESATLAPGTRVFFETAAGRAPVDGSLAPRCATPDEMVVPIEVPVPDVEVAALGMSAVAAWQVLTARARLRPGERVLVLGGGGAVGQAAVGAARVLGAARVVAVCRSAAARERAERAGADAVVPLTDDVDALTAALADALDGGADVVVDPVCGTAATAAARVLAPGGRLVNLGGASGDTATFSSSVLRSRSAEILGYTNVTLTPQERRLALDAVLAHAAAGALAVESEQVPLADVAAAWERQATGRATRRLVLTLTPPDRPSRRSDGARHRGQHHRPRRAAVADRARPADGRGHDRAGAAPARLRPRGPADRGRVDRRRRSGSPAPGRSAARSARSSSSPPTSSACRCSSSR